SRGIRFGKSGNEIHRAAAGGRGHHAESAGGAGVPVGHGGGGEFVFGDHAGHRAAGVEDGVVEVFDIGAVDAEDMPHIEVRHGANQIVHNSVGHRTSFQRRVGSAARRLEGDTGAPTSGFSLIGAGFSGSLACTYTSTYSHCHA